MSVILGSYKKGDGATLSQSSGYAILYVMVAMVVVMALGSAFLQHWSVSESRAIYESLAESRIRTMMTGILRYGVNRLQRLEWSNDQSKITSFRDALLELDGTVLDGEMEIQVESAELLNVPTVTEPLVWRVPLTVIYPREGQGDAIYAFKVWVDIIDAVVGQDNGDLILEFSLTTPTLAAGKTLIHVLQHMETRFPGLRYAYRYRAESQGRILRPSYPKSL